MLYHLLRQMLFLMPAETAHHVTLEALRIANRLGLTDLLPPAPVSPVSVMGLNFPNPVGLAAGLDKNGDYILPLAALGFGSIEIGTITPRPQPGNPHPRLFRLPSERAIINRMGFNNKGVDHLVRQVEAARFHGILGINIGKNADTPVEKALDDYLHCLRKVYAHASYVAVNISSPNTAGLRNLQKGDAFKALLDGLRNEQELLADQHGRRVPMAIKIAPDLESGELDFMIDQFVEYNIDAIIATNTTVRRDMIAGHPLAGETGGLSGAPVREPSNQVLAQLCQKLAGRIPVIGVGGILSADDAMEKFRLGASLVQIYTGFIYQGPQLVRETAERHLSSGI